MMGDEYYVPPDSMGVGAVLYHPCLFNIHPLCNTTPRFNKHVPNQTRAIQSALHLDFNS